MAKISELDPVGTLTGSELIPVLSGGKVRKVTYTGLAEAVVARAEAVPAARFGVGFTDYDASGKKVSVAIHRSGKIEMASADIRMLGGRNTDAFLRASRPDIVMPYDVAIIQNDGQSLSVSGLGGGRGLVPVPNGDTLSWPFKVANPAQGSEVGCDSINPKVNQAENGNANISVGVCPGHGAVAMLRQLWREEEGIAVADQPRLFMVANGTGSTPLSLHVEGQTSFETGMTQAAASREHARSRSLRGRFAFKLIIDTEADSSANTPPATYQDQMINKLSLAQARRYKAIAPEQSFDPLLISSQAASIIGNQRWAIARTIYKMALDRPENLLFSGPIYDLPYIFDRGGYPNFNDGGLHPTQLGAYLHGARMGLVGYRRTRGLDVRPIRCVARNDDGKTLFLTFALRYGKRLVRGPIGWTTTQPNCGIACFDESNGGAAVPFTAEPSICRDFVTLAFPLGTAPRAGLRIDFGQPAQKMYPYSPGTYSPGRYTGAALDLHDDFGLMFRDDAMGIEYPMVDHFPVHSIRLTASGAGFEITDPTTGG